MMHMEAQHLPKFKIRYFSDMINIEEVWKKIDIVLTSSVPQGETEARSVEPLQLKLIELEWVHKVYDEVTSATSSQERHVFFDIQKREKNLKSIIEDIMLTKEKVAELEKLGKKLNKF